MVQRRFDIIFHPFKTYYDGRKHFEIQKGEISLNIPFMVYQDWKKRF
jgi:hypothetical protein